MNSDNDAIDPPTYTGWDTYLYVINGPCSSDTILAQDDDGGPGDDSRITTSLSIGTNYLCECTSYGRNATGYFNLQVIRLT